ncbi:MAG: hypothetical protein XD60_0537 [Acetothermia bacterium 64_32]|nr:MAG: hypothetical protein XD60_0537 [Acetothermia bacterium 64_32]HAF71164.1 hypothetical protein [Candidatus Acetothermia bacterium]
MIQALLGAGLLCLAALGSEPLFKQDFQTETDFPQIFCGVEGGSYLIEIQSGSYTLDFPIPGLEAADFRLEVTFILEGFRGEVGYGAYFRDGETGGYEVELTQDGSVYLWRYDESGYELLLEYRNVLWVEAPGENRVSLECRGASVSLWVNGHRVFAFPGLAPGEGGLGLWATTYDPKGSIRLRLGELVVFP